MMEVIFEGKLSFQELSQFFCAIDVTVSLSIIESSFLP